MMFLYNFKKMQKEKKGIALTKRLLLETLGKNAILVK